MQLLKQIEDAKNNPGQNDRSSGTGYLIPMYSRPEGLKTSYVGVITDEGLFAIDIPSNDALAQDLKTQSYQSPVEVEVGIDSVYYDGQKVAKRTRYDGNAFDPTSQNTGNIEIVHKMGNSGDLVLTSIDSNRNGLDFRAHGQTLLNNILESVNEMVRSDDFDKGKLSKYYQFVDCLYGENMDVDYEMLELQPRGTGMRAAKARFLTKKIETGTTMMLHGHTSEEAAAALSGEDGNVDIGENADEADADASEDTSEAQETHAVESVEGDSPNGLQFS